jgi:hypothetical protein
VQYAIAPYALHLTALDYKTPDEVYITTKGGGAKIVDKFSGTTETSLVPQNWDSPIQQECEQSCILN